MKLKTLKDLYIDELRDMYNAESQILKALPKMAKAAASDELREAFEHHLQQTEEHRTRLEKIFAEVGEKPKGVTCKGMQGIIEEGNEMMDEDAEAAVADAALIASAQRVEHYEIAVYGTLRAYAERLGLEDSVELLTRTLDEEGAADEKLTQLAESGINDDAAHGAEEEHDEDSDGGDDSGHDEEDEEREVGAPTRRSAYAKAQGSRPNLGAVRPGAKGTPATIRSGASSSSGGMKLSGSMPSAPRSDKYNATSYAGPSRPQVINPQMGLGNKARLHGRSSRRGRHSPR